MQALVRGKREQEQQGCVWHFSNMWFSPAFFTLRMAKYAAADSKRDAQQQVSYAAYADAC